MNQRIPMVFFLIPALWLIPVLAGYMSSLPPEKEFLGFIRSDDFHRYGSFMEQTARYNRVIYMDYSTVEPQSPRMIAVYFTILGLLKKLIPLSDGILWAVAGFLTNLAFVFIIWRFFKQTFRQMNLVRLATWLALFSSGIDNLLELAHVQIPRVKNYWMDGFSTFNTMHNPLKIAGILLTILLIANEMSGNRRRYRTLITAALILLLWAVHPNSAIPAYCALLGAVVFPLRFKRWSDISYRCIQALPWLIPFGLIFLYVEWMKTDSMVANILRQYQMSNASEPFGMYPARYGIILPFALWGLYRSIRNPRPSDGMMAGWLSGALAFSNVPFMTGLLFQHMVHLPLAYFSTEPIWTTLQKFRFATTRRIIPAVVFLSFLAANGHTIIKVSLQTARDVWPTSLYASDNEIKMMALLAGMPDGNVLVNRDTGNKIGWLSLKNVFLGHWGTTPRKGNKEKEIIGFFNIEERNEWRTEFLRRYGIKYIWYGPREREWGPIPAHLNADLIEVIGDVELYRWGSR